LNLILNLLSVEIDVKNRAVEYKHVAGPKCGQIGGESELLDRGV